MKTYRILHYLIWPFNWKQYLTSSLLLNIQINMKVSSVPNPSNTVFIILPLTCIKDVHNYFYFRQLTSKCDVSDGTDIYDSQLCEAWIIYPKRLSAFQSTNEIPNTEIHCIIIHHKSLRRTDCPQLASLPNVTFYEYRHQTRSFNLENISTI